MTIHEVFPCLCVADTAPAIAFQMQRRDTAMFDPH